MLKLVTVNIERDNHYERIIPFLTRENPDVICLQEVPIEFSPQLHKLGYETSFAPMALQPMAHGDSPAGVMIASKIPHESKTHYYHTAAPTMVKIDNSDKENTESFAYILAKISVQDSVFHIATTHMIDTKDGREDDFQIKGMTNLLDALSQEEPHLICGDFNMPRGYNSLYIDVIEKYTDCIPLEYKSSLDRNLHRFGNKIINEPIFDEYMVDYIFTQSPYQARDVRLEFGVSDHAAAIATITK